MGRKYVYFSIHTRGLKKAKHQIPARESLVNATDDAISNNINKWNLCLYTK